MTPSTEDIAQTILEALKQQVQDAPEWIDDTDGLDDVVLDGSFSLVRVAKAVRTLLDT
ncbi:hypothetical protein [Microvirga sp. VF16]|uniref:hypothetical protein n=1 Tax=Microvirga sp. VF16 TaxID=2807101 RepID=UPI001FF02A74|nr:hypothetical protein [Microvirga sp. VF16]